MDSEEDARTVPGARKLTGIRVSPRLDILPEGFSEKMAELLAPLTKAFSEKLSAQLRVVVPPELLERLQNLEPPNWREVEEPDYDAALQIMNDGIPLIWVPRATVVSDLMHADDTTARLAVLTRSSPDIAQDCMSALAEISDPDLRPLAFLATRAAEAVADGHYEAAQALAANVVDTWLRAAVRRGALFTAVPEKTPGWYAKVRGQVPFVSDDMHFAELKPSGSMAPVSLALARFDSQLDPRPRVFGRHATAHAAYPEQYSQANSVIAVMLAASVLRQSGESGW